MLTRREHGTRYTQQTTRLVLLFRNQAAGLVLLDDLFPVRQPESGRAVELVIGVANFAALVALFGPFGADAFARAEFEAVLLLQFPAREPQFPYAIGFAFDIVFFLHRLLARLIKRDPLAVALAFLKA